jgi:two-component system chemotaxis response regulator CheB
MTVGRRARRRPAVRRLPLRVLAVDDSAVVRQTVSAVFANEASLSVTVAADPLIAIDKMKRDRPDVILLDLEMPRMDGLTFLRRVMAEDPIPVVVCSALTGPGTEAALRAIEEGAVDIVNKPRLGVRDFLSDSRVMLVDALHAAAAARLRRRGPELAAPHAPVPTPPEALPVGMTTDKIVAIGASTGGTEALRLILEAMPPDAPGLAIVQHMPEGFTRAFAQRLDQHCRIEVKEAVHGDRLCDGRALIAPGNRHMSVRRSGAQYVVDVTDGPLVSRHRPSVNVLFRSVAQTVGPSAVGVILTGMGDDGADGLLEMKRMGAATIAQDERTCVVFGMPREAVARGAVDDELALREIPERILLLARNATRTRLGRGQSRRDR